MTVNKSDCETCTVAEYALAEEAKKIIDKILLTDWKKNVSAGTPWVYVLLSELEQALGGKILTRGAITKIVNDYDASWTVEYTANYRGNRAEAIFKFS